MSRGGPQRPYGPGRADYSGSNLRGYGTGYRETNRVAYGQTSSYEASSNQGYTSDWNQATRGGTTQPHGYQHNGPNHTHFQSSYRASSRDGQAQHVYPSPSSSSGPKPPRKRPFSTAFSKATDPRPQAAPAVPSFNAGIASLLPEKSAEVMLAQPKNKRPRKHNQLGLTPASQDHESSSDDENEEAKLAATRGLVTRADFMQFEYKGQPAVLKTASEIAAWIAERKKKYPTIAKAEAAKNEAAEKKRKWAEEKRQREETAKAKRLQLVKSQREVEELRWKLLDDQKGEQQEKIQKEAKKDGKDAGEQDGDHALNKARLKAEKLRRKAEKAEIKAIKAEAAAKIAKVRRGSMQRQDSSERKESSIKDGDSAIVIEDCAEGHQEIQGLEHGEDSNTEISGLPSTSNVKAEELEDGQVSPDASSSSSLSVSNSSEVSDSDLTSSSGSSSSSDFDSDSAPEQATTKRTAPDRVVIPPRQRRPCRNMMKFSKCRDGTGCPFSHDIPEKHRQPKRKAEETPAKKNRRKGLWQVMVDKELEEERKQVLRAIMFMGEKGMLDEDKVLPGKDKATSSEDAINQAAESEVKATSSEDAMIQAAAAKGIMT